MTTWITADLHFSHKNIIKYCNRPFKHAEQMNRKLINNFNAKVAKDDLVFFLGDMFLGNKTKSIEAIKQLHGYKILIRGNHDTHISHEEWVGDFGMKEVWESYIYYIGGISVIMAHDPVDSLYLARNCGCGGTRVILNGHLHDIQKFTTDKGTGNTSMNVGVDVYEYFPKEITQIISDYLKETSNAL